MEIKLLNFIDGTEPQIHKILSLGIVGVNNDGIIFGPDESLWYKHQQIDNPNIKTYVAAHIVVNARLNFIPWIITNIDGWLPVYYTYRKRDMATQLGNLSIRFDDKGPNFNLNIHDRNILKHECSMYL